jgi:hypothetical protein
MKISVLWNTMPYKKAERSCEMLIPVYQTMSQPPKTVILILAIARASNLTYSKEQLAGGTLYTHSYTNVFESEI